MSESKQFSFKIIAGELKGRRIVAPNIGGTRPPLSRVRKSIFDFLMPNLSGANYLDLFSGTGSYLFEAVSRGVAFALGVERDPRLTQAINDQAKRFTVSERIVCVCDNVFTALEGNSITRPLYEVRGKGNLFDIVMIAPPQYIGLIDKTLEAISQTSLVSPKGLILCQHDTKESSRIRFSPYETVQQRKYGNTTFTVLRSAG